MKSLFDNTMESLQKGLSKGAIERAVSKAEEEWVWVEGYKGTNSEMMCRDQQYEIGKTYVMPEGSDIKVCESGFHLCLGLVEVFDYYSIGSGNRFFKVKALVRKSDLDNMAEPKKTYMRNNSLFRGWTMPSLSYDPTTNTLVAASDPDDKLSAKSIEFVSELTMDEIFEKTYAKDWSEEDKKLALIEGLSKVDSIIELRELEKKQKEQEDALVGLGYSRPFASLIIQDGKYEKAYAVGTQTDLSMDMKVLTIFR